MRLWKRYPVVLTVYFLCELAPGAHAAVIHVPADQPTIQAGIDVAEASDTVLVADGTYTGSGNRDIDFSGKAIVVTSANGPEVTVIDCQASASDMHRGVYFHTGEDLSSILEGFTIKNGYYTGDYPGAGILCYSDSSPTIRDCIITANYGCGIVNWESDPVISRCEVTNNTGPQGAGIWIEAWSAQITDCLIQNNSADHGGGIFFGSCDRSTKLENCIVTQNTASTGGGICCFNASPVILNCVVSSNTATEGAGIYSENGSPLIEDCTIENNLNAALGGGVSLRGGAPWIAESAIRGNTIASNGDSVFGGGLFILDSDALLTECIVRANTATDGTASSAFGGGMYIHSTDYYHVVITNSLIEANAAIHGTFGNGGYGGGMFCGNGSVGLNSCTIANNTAATEGGPVYAEGGSTVSMYDCISWGNDPAELDGMSAVNYSDIQGSYPGSGNIDLDPMFVAGPLGAFYLSQLATGQAANSPCIDAGFGTAAGCCYADPDGHVCLDELTTRTDEITDSGTVDMGFHYPSSQPQPTPTPQPTPSPTPEMCYKPGVELWMPSHYYHPGDPVSCTVFVCNAESTPLEQYRLFVVLMAYGEVFFWPSFDQSIDSWTDTWEPGVKEISILLEFSWPDGTGSVKDAMFISALMAPDDYDIYGGIDVWNFGWGP